MRLLIALLALTASVLGQTNLRVTASTVFGEVGNGTVSVLSAEGIPSQMTMLDGKAVGVVPGTEPYQMYVQAAGFHPGACCSHAGKGHVTLDPVRWSHRTAIPSIQSNRYLGIADVAASATSYSVQRLTGGGMLADLMTRHDIRPRAGIAYRSTGSVTLAIQPDLSTHEPLPATLQHWVFTGTGWVRYADVPVAQGWIVVSPLPALTSGLSVFGDVMEVIPAPPCGIDVKYLGMYKRCVPTVTGHFNAQGIHWGSSRTETVTQEVTTTSTTTSGSSSNAGSTSTSSSSLNSAVEAGVQAGWGPIGASASARVASQIESGLETQSGMQVSTTSTQGTQVTTSRALEEKFESTSGFNCPPGIIGQVQRVRVYYIYRWELVGTPASDPRCANSAIIECRIHAGYDNVVLWDTVSWIGPGTIPTGLMDALRASWSSDCTW